MSKWTLVFVVALVLRLGIVAWKIHKNRVVEAGFDSVKVGDSQSDVIRLMGAPDKIEPCNTFWPLDIPFPAKCQEEYLYKNSFAPPVPHYFLIYFGPNDRVIKTVPLSSP